MALNSAGLVPHFPMLDDSNMWQFPMATDDFQSQEDPEFKDMALFDEQAIFSRPSDSSGASSISPMFHDHGVPSTVQPRNLHGPSPSSETSHSPSSRHNSIDSSTSSYLSPDRREVLRRLSLATLDADAGDSYRPRSSPLRPRRATTTRIKPRDDKHARELELNRKAATKCRNRQKAFVENLQERCRREEQKMHIQTSLVHALHDEVVSLRNEVLRHSFCDCRFIQHAISANTQ
ncbi:hypothetical protein A1O1_03014 [Capronia coronata CBS 617.96]|uniref:BZIP domain-containing protein n=1 Tax=Capronia coronata CBS 617.96 TaxID=1182541 RepID=W9YPY2_9EURO|nr:uncharacterized protein A1O1_03014 [Capronia coronata CBS 617.96]EXJ94618.1 hypothetical protein A1O1_03014 [Capronia coronata CBS 617.96]